MDELNESPESWQAARIRFGRLAERSRKRAAQRRRTSRETLEPACCMPAFPI